MEKLNLSLGICFLVTVHAFLSRARLPADPMKSYFRNLFYCLVVEEDGVAATEYAIMIALILVFCIAALLSTGDVQKALWIDTADKLEIITR